MGQLLSCMDEQSPPPPKLKSLIDMSASQLSFYLDNSSEPPSPKSPLSTSIRYIYSSYHTLVGMITVMRTSNRPKLFLLGDSITQFSFDTPTNGWGNLLANYYQSRQVDILNRGYSGYNSRWINQLLPKIATTDVIKESIIATIFLGANDAVIEGEVQHVGLEEFRRNITNIIDHLRTINESLVIILITPPQIDHLKWNSTRDPPAKVNTRHNDSVRKYADIIIDLGRTCTVDVLDLWNGAQKIEKKDLVDGLHLNSTGNKKIFEGITQIITTKYPHLGSTSTDMITHYPDWKSLSSNEDESNAILESWSWAGASS